MTGHNPLPVYDHCLRCGGRCVQLSTGKWRHIERYREDSVLRSLDHRIGHTVWQEAEPR